MICLVYHNNSYTSCSYSTPLAFVLNATVGGMPTTELVAVEGDVVEICFVANLIITRTPLEIGIRAISSATNATVNGTDHCDTLQ